MNFHPPLIPLPEELTQALTHRLSSDAVEVAQVLVRLRSDEKAMRAFPNLDELLWVDTNLLAGPLKAQRKATVETGFEFVALDDLEQARVIVYERRKISKRPSVGFRFLPRSVWDLRRDAGAWPFVGDCILRSVKDRPEREIARVTSESVTWRWFGSKYTAVQFREHEASREEWNAWVRSATQVIRVEEGVP